MRVLFLLALLLCGCFSNKPKPLEPVLDIVQITSKTTTEPDIAQITSKTTMEPEPPKFDIPLDPEERRLEIAAYQKLHKELVKIETLLTEQLESAENPLIFFLSDDKKKKIEISVRSGELLISYLAAIKRDLQARIQVIMDDQSSTRSSQ